MRSVLRDSTSEVVGPVAGGWTRGDGGINSISNRDLSPRDDVAGGRARYDRGPVALGHDVGRIEAREHSAAQMGRPVGSKTTPAWVMPANAPPPMSSSRYASTTTLHV